METKNIKSWPEFFAYILIILGLIAVVNYLGSWWFSRLDLTEGKIYSVSPATKKILKNLDDIINVKVYFSKNLPPNMSKTVTEVKDMLAEYQALAGKKLRISWVDPAESDTLKSEARSMGIPEIQLQTVEQDKAQVMNGYLGIAIIFEKRKEVLPVVQDLQDLEYNLTMSIVRVKRSSTPKVGILKVDTLPNIPPQYLARMPQQPERTDVKFSSLFAKLKENYDVATIDVSKGDPIDPEIKTLIVPGTAPLTDRGLFEVDQFFMKGGNLIALANSMKVDFQYYGPMANPVDSKLLDLLQFYGAKIEQNMVLDASCGQVQIPQKVNTPFGVINADVPVPYPYFVRIGADGMNRDNPAVAPLSDVVMPWPNAISLQVDLAPTGKNDKGSAKQPATASGQSGVKATILAQSSKKSWTASGSIDLNPQQKWQVSAGTPLKPSTLAAFLTGSFKSFFAGKSVPPVNQAVKTDSLSKITLKPEPIDTGRKIIPANAKGNLVVVGSVDFVSAQNGSPQNLMMVMNLVDWLSQGDNLISIRTRAVKDRTINVDLLKKGSALPSIIRFVNILTMPLLLVIVGLLIFLGRREQIAPVPLTSFSGGASGEKTEEKHA
jgi:ABC-2 type transport system permease protein